MADQDLFGAAMQSRMAAEQPLAARMRPTTLEQFVGQEHIVAPGRLLYRAIKADQLSSLVFYGPPGTGKTTLAQVIAKTTKAQFITINAVLSGVKEIRGAIEKAKEQRQYQSQRTILFVDEVHRWNKAQQDALLPWVENGTLILIGATTENPFFEVNKALVSRSRVFQLRALDRADLRRIAEQALTDEERGYGTLEVRIDPDAIDHLIDVADGDARSLLNALELAVETTPESFPPPPGTIIHIDRGVAEESIQKRAVLYDKEGDYHFDTISAFIKSLRGSDPDAALYWMARMIYAGEDPRFIFRRMLIFASEDVGLADPNALVITEAAAGAFDRVGLPEGRFHLSQAALYLATAAKSNSTMAFFEALASVEKESVENVPNHLRDASRDAEGFGHGQGYQYPHAYQDHWVAQQYLPDELKGRVFFDPSESGYEAGIKEAVLQRREVQLEAYRELFEPTPEVLTFSPLDSARERWLARADSGVTTFQADIRERLLATLKIPRHGVILDLSENTAFLTWELLRRVPEGSLFTCAPVDRSTDGIVKLERGQLIARLSALGHQDVRFDIVIGRNILVHADIADRLVTVAQLLRVAGSFACVENLPDQGQRLTDLINANDLDATLFAAWKEAENAVYKGTGISSDDLRRGLSQAGFSQVELDVHSYDTQRRIGGGDITRWFDVINPKSYASQLTPHLDAPSLRSIQIVVDHQLAERSVLWRQHLAFAKAIKTTGA